MEYYRNSSPDWWPVIYEDILNEFGFSREEDVSAARVLASILGSDNGDSLKSGDSVVVVGAAIEDTGKVRELKDSGYAVYSCDGATTALIRDGQVPDVIVTDMDGRMEDILTAVDSGAVPVIHAHGDNIHHIKEYAPRMAMDAVGTCQCEPFGGLYNFGGFTDGDRAVAMAMALGASDITLAGFDFNTIGGYSFNSDPAVKLRKLRYAERIIALLSKEIVRRGGSISFV